MGGPNPESGSVRRGRNRSFMCTFRAKNAFFSSVTRCYRMKYKLPFNPEKGLKFQYFPVLSRREGILECPLFSSASSSRVAVSIFGILCHVCSHLSRTKVISRGVVKDRSVLTQRRRGAEGAAVVGWENLDESFDREARLKPVPEGQRVISHTTD